ncbi:MAG: tRNA pseudouridine(38-40) synthase TruA [Dehalococcoidia bacterium]
MALLVEYEGTGYHGFQVQDGVPTIQGELEKAIWRVTCEAVRVRGAGRTDAGVHARGQVAAFETSSTLSRCTFVRALNFYLPLDIVISNACEVKAEFDPRRDALSRWYRYIILNRPIRSPLWRKWACFIKRELDVSLMEQAVKALVGEHDFASFTGSQGVPENTVRKVSKAEVSRDGELVIFDMVANAFLPHQVRRTVGSLIKLGLGKIGVERFYDLVDCASIGKAAVAAPPYGLYLMKVNYSDIGFEQ